MATALAVNVQECKRACEDVLPAVMDPPGLLMYIDIAINPEYSSAYKNEVRKQVSRLLESSDSRYINWAIRLVARSSSMGPVRNTACSLLF